MRARRLFFALPLSPRLQQRIAHWRAGLALPRCRPVPPENLHLTLKFLGMVADDRLPALLAIAGALHPPRFGLVLAHLDCWHGGILHLAPGKTPARMLRLVEALDAALEAQGYAREGRVFRAHLTLARDCRAPVHAETPRFALEARRFVLMESRDGRYDELASWPLGITAKSP